MSGLMSGVTAHPATAALSHFFLIYRRIWRADVFSSFVIPVLWLTAIGVGVGHYVDRGTGALGVDYLSYLAPGLLASIIFNQGVAECSWPVYGSIKWNRRYFAMLATPLRVTDVMLGHLGYAASRMAMNAVGFLCVMALFGTLHAPFSPAAVPAAVLTGLAAATPTYAFAATISSESRFVLLYRFGVVPVTLFSGVFFPIGQLPSLLLPLAWLSPLWHGVELCRSATLGMAPALPVTAHAGYLALWIVGGCLLTHRALTRRLVV